MHLIRRIETCPELRSGSVVSIGNYDGVHIGHHALLSHVRAQGSRLSLPTCVMTFEPMPSEFFGQKHSPGRLSTWRERYQLIKAQGIDVLYLVPFDAKLASLSPQAFIQTYLSQRLNTRLLYVGDDFRFGKGRTGSIDTLKELAPTYSFEVEQLPTVKSGGARVSSSLVRDRLLAGDLDHAAALLGRRYSMSGTVVRGQQLGRTLGFPTVNIRPRRNSLPMSGVFAVVVTREVDNYRHDGVANLGFRPTVGGGDALLEAHIFDFDSDLYGERVTIEFIHKLREEEHFASLDLMVEQMHQDASEARRILNKIDS